MLVGSRSFIYLDDELVCSVDPWDMRWSNNERIIFRWAHTREDLDIQVAIPGVLASLDYAERF